MDEMGVVRELKVVSVVGTQLCELGGKVGWMMQGVVCEAWSLSTTARETRRNVVACLAPDRHSCSHVLVAPLFKLYIFRRQSNLLRSKFQHDIL